MLVEMPNLIFRVRAELGTHTSAMRSYRLLRSAPSVSTPNAACAKPT